MDPAIVKQVVSAVSTALGNSGTKALKRLRSRRWCFTLNNYTEDEYDHICSYLSHFGQRFIVGKEIGKKNGIPHLQGYFEFKNQKDLLVLKKDLNGNMHLEKAHGTKNENITYCSKDGNFVSKNCELDYEESPTVLDESELYPWQQELLRLIREETPNSRSIYWIYDKIGNNGKSELCKFLAWNKLSMYIQSGKASDIKNILMEKKNSRDICIDLSRSNENFVSYTVMEELKNGYIFSGKYEGGFKFITTPNVFVFANFLPDLSKMSEDRWVIKELDDRVLKDYIEIPIEFEDY